ncbi:MAG: carboxylating nicotinate-nucleotide diphosphorylase [Candidatus Nanopelagicaceae bacterium]|nr:carboxylating nicotinate-nucleotide diphosphorylase [Candidatus Nanopelagicaceae bacterium]
MRYQISDQTRQDLFTASLNPEQVVDLIQRAFEEDLQGGEDVTSVATIPIDHLSTGEFRTRAAGVVAGIPIARAVLEMVGIGDIATPIVCAHKVESGTVVMSVRANTRALLLAERTALNFLGHLSGIATLTRRWVDEVSEFGTLIRDTRKTTPGLRELEKYAVRMGGGTNHRMSLSDAALIKDNHIEAVGGVVRAFQSVRSLYPHIEVEVEVDTLEQLQEILLHDPDCVLLDNMSVEECRQAVEITAGRCKLEASGGLSLNNARAYAQTGVDYLAVGALTHSAPVFDIGLDLKAEI